MLVGVAHGRHKHGVDTPDIFDRHARRLRRDRAVADYPRHDFLRNAMLDGISERLASVTRPFADMLDLGCFDARFTPPGPVRIARCDAGAGFARQGCGVQADEDALPFADASFDLILSCGVLDSVNDLPGALTLVRRALRPDGLFMGAFVGAGSLASLRRAFREAEADRPAARLHPQIDVRSAGDLLQRAGFALPVADIEPLTVRYADMFGLLRDLRGMAATSLLPGRTPMRRDALARAAAAFAAQADGDGRVAETFTLIFLTGWAPAPSQPQPARRGSATASLADALRPPVR